MHELAIVQSICDAALDEARRHGAARVRSVTCRAGVLRQLVPEMMESAFLLLSEGTPLEGARLTVEREGVVVACAACGNTGTVYEIPRGCSACLSSEVRCTGGQDIMLTAMEIDREAGDGNPGIAAP
jgi:hydrogenase nickel incorporation protein HypA/HybF